MVGNILYCNSFNYLVHIWCEIKKIKIAKAGFGHLKIGKHGLYAVYNKMYDAYGFDTMKDAISSVYDFVIGLAF